MSCEGGPEGPSGGTNPPRPRLTLSPAILSMKNIPSSAPTNVFFDTSSVRYPSITRTRATTSTEDAHRARPHVRSSERIRPPALTPRRPREPSARAPLPRPRLPRHHRALRARQFPPPTPRRAVRSRPPRAPAHRGVLPRLHLARTRRGGPFLDVPLHVHGRRRPVIVRTRRQSAGLILPRPYQSHHGR